MARLFMQHSIMRLAHQMDVRYRNNLRRMARYNNKALSMSDEEFRSNYRLTKALFFRLCEDLEPIMSVPKRRSDISSKYKILVALSFYATGSYQRLVGGTYGTLMSQQSVSRALRDVTAALNSPQILQKYLRFPQNQQERDAIKRRFYEKFGIPPVVGCIDGTHIAIIRPSENEERFYNRKHFHSRNVLIIADSDLHILSVDSSFGGASHDSFIFNQHPIRQHLIELINTGERVYLLGDSGYAQREFMMTPIVDATVGSPEEHYTKLHCTARNTVERTIGVLKNRWRCLLGHRVLHYHPDVAARITNACCVLHNICNRARMNIEEMQNVAASVIQDEVDLINPPLQGRGSIELQRGLEARSNLVHQLWGARR